jgi:phenylalanine-4-hydroxylase
MKSESAYVSKTPDENGIFTYTAEENSIWADLYARQLKALENHAAQIFWDGLDALSLPQDRVPQVKEVSEKLNQITGFGVEAVPALISPSKFFTLLSERKFPAATFIRTREEFDYLKEPDIFHEIFGHCPMLTNPIYADFMQKYGEMSLKMDKQYLWLMQKLFWFTVEFGLIKENGKNRIYGAGIASSAGETPYSIDSDQPERRPFDPVSVFRTPYRIDIYQTIYYVIDDLKQIFDTINTNMVPLLKEANRLGQFEPTFPPKEGGGKRVTY